MSERLAVLRASVEHLAALAARLDPGQYTSPAYPSEWTIADTFSHLGSGAVIAAANLDNVLAGRVGDPTFNQSVWDEWNAKAPADQVADALAANERLLAALEATSDEERARFRFQLGPFDLDFAGYVGLRLGEQVLHTWDVEVSVDPGATLDGAAANEIIDGLPRVVRFAAKVSDEERTVSVRTSDPTRELALVFEPDSVSLVESDHDGPVDLAMPAESFVRLVYGRLDADHTPSVLDGDELDELRRAFPGF